MLFVLVMLIVAAAMAYSYDRYAANVGYWRLDVKAAGIYAAVVAAAVPLSMIAQDHLAVGQQLEGFHEFLGGVVYRVDAVENRCVRDGDCRHTYQCDPYTVWDTEPVYDSKGKQTGTRRVSRTEWHDCPYSTVEIDYVASVTYGFKQEQVVTDSAVFPERPVEWRRGEGLPGVQRGPSLRWSRWAAAVRAGEAPPYVGHQTYPNFLLASQDTLLKRSSAAIAKYRKAGLMPPHTRGVAADADVDDVVVGGYADKFTAIGVRADDGEWNDRLNRFNARLGLQLQGDLHVVAVPASKVVNPSEYASALIVDWQSDRYGKWALSKNGVALVLGVDGGRVKWARAKTGMPVGNDGMAFLLASRLEGVKFDPDVVFGSTVVLPGSTDPKFAEVGDGIVPRVMLVDAPFKRACMVCDDKGERDGGFTYLGDEIVPDVSWVARLVSVLLLATIFGATLFVLSGYLAESTKGRHQ